MQEEKKRGQYESHEEHGRGKQSLGRVAPWLDSRQSTIFSAFALGVSREEGTTLESRLFCSRTHRNHPLFRHLKPKFWDTAPTQKESSAYGSNCLATTIAFRLRTRALATCLDDLVEEEESNLPNPSPLNIPALIVIEIYRRTMFPCHSPARLCGCERWS